MGKIPRYARNDSRDSSVIPAQVENHRGEGEATVPFASAQGDASENAGDAREGTGHVGRRAARTSP